MSEQEYDVIVIGSGMGGLAAASLLAQIDGRRVLILEQLFKAGGLTNAFKRAGGRKWNVGLHYAGKMGAGSLDRQVFEMVTGGNIKWYKLPDPLERFVYPDFSFEVPEGRQTYEQRLIDRFPLEADGIRQYFADVELLASMFVDNLLAEPRPVDLFHDPVATETTGSYLARTIGDPRLRALLASQWGDYGVPPAQSAFVAHAMLVDNYLDGAHFPVGGADGIANAVEPLIEAHGGKILTNYRVTDILIEDGVAVGVKASISQARQTREETFHAPVIISDVGAYQTYCHLCPAELDLPFREEAARMADMGYQVVTLFIGFNTDPRDLGFDGENHWLYADLDHDAMYARRNALFEGQPEMAFLSFPSLNDPEVETHLGQIVAPLDYAMFEAWQDLPWRKRGDDYLAVKERIAQSLLDFVDRHYAGFKESVDYYEMGTPLTYRHFMGHHRGIIYGLPGTPERFRCDWLQARTPAPNLYLTGVDAAVTRISGALLGGVTAAGLALGEGGTTQIMTAVKRWRRAKEPE